MKIFKDKKIIALIIILVVFTIGYFIIVNKISYAFVTDYNANEIYDKTIEVIKASAIVYGEKNLDLFKDNDTIYIRVQDLIDNNLLVPNEEGGINNPLKEKETLNSNMIKIKYEDKKISVEVDS